MTDVRRKTNVLILLGIGGGFFLFGVYLVRTHLRQTPVTIVHAKFHGWENTQGVLRAKLTLPPVALPRLRWLGRRAGYTLAKIRYMEDNGSWRTNSTDHWPGELLMLDGRIEIVEIPLAAEKVQITLSRHWERRMRLFGLDVRVPGRDVVVYETSLLTNTVKAH